MKKKNIIITTVVLAIVATATVALTQTKAISVFAGDKSVLIKTEPIVKGNIISVVSVNGNIEEVDKAEVYLDQGYKVDKILVEKNDVVKKGQKLLEVNIDDFKSQLEQNQVKKKVQELTISKLRITDGTKSTGALDASIVIAETSYTNAKNAYDDAIKTYEKNKLLYTANAISKNELDKAEKAATDASNALKTAKANTDSAKYNLEDVYKSNLNSQSSTNIELETQEQNLKGTILSIEELDRKIKKINDSLYAPIDGTVTEVNLKVGAMTNTAQFAFYIVNTDKLQIRAIVKEFDIRNITVGQKVSITGDAITDKDGVIGTVKSIAPMAKKNKTTTGDEVSIDVLISVDKSTPQLKPGLGTTCSIATNEKKDTVLVGLGMINEDKDSKKYVFVYNQELQTIEQRIIKIGITSDMFAEVIEGLKEGDIVVVDPQPTLKDGAKVKLNNSEKK